MSNSFSLNLGDRSFPSALETALTTRGTQVKLCLEVNGKRYYCDATPSSYTRTNNFNSVSPDVFELSANLQITGGYGVENV